MYKHVFWDFDGTMFDSYPSMTRSFMNIVNMTGNTMDFDELLFLLKVSEGYAHDECAKRFTGFDGAYQEYKRKTKILAAYDSAPYAGIPELLIDIKLAGGYNYLVTHRGDTLFPLTDKFGVTPDFRGIVTVLDGFPRKPDPAANNYLIEKYSIDVRDAIMLGDREMDVLSGWNAGMDSCAFLAYDKVDIKSYNYTAKTVDESRNVIFMK